MLWASFVSACLVVCQLPDTQEPGFSVLCGVSACVSDPVVWEQVTLVNGAQKTYVECVGQKEHLRNLFIILVYVLAVLSLFIKNA